MNFYTGCSNNCDYCYCKRGVMAHVWSNRPHLKKCFKSEFDAFSIFKKEVEKNIEDVRKSGLLLSFTTDLCFQCMHRANELAIAGELSPDYFHNVLMPKTKEAITAVHNMKAELDNVHKQLEKRS